MVVRERRSGALAAVVREEDTVPEDSRGQEGSKACCQDPGWRQRSLEVRKKENCETRELGWLAPWMLMVAGHGVQR